MKRGYLISVVLLGSCCRSSVVGVYQGKAEMIELKKDSTFSYAFDAGWNKVRSSGTWNYWEDKKIILNTSYDHESIPITVEELETSSNELLFKVDPITPADASIKDSLQYFIVFKGIDVQVYPGVDAKIEARNIESFRIKILFPFNEDVRPYILHKEIFTNVYQIKNPEASSLTVSFPLELDIFYSNRIDVIE